MQRTSSPSDAGTVNPLKPRPFRNPLWRWILGATGLAVLATLMATAKPQQSTSSDPDKSYLRPEANRVRDKNDQMQLRQDHAKNQQFEASNAERKKQLSDDTSRLVELATQLKAEVDKTSKDTLSINVIRKAESIERLARGVKEKMKLTVGAS